MLVKSVIGSITFNEHFERFNY